LLQIAQRRRSKYQYRHYWGGWDFSMSSTRAYS
jgi:hypothetical protein